LTDTPFPQFNRQNYLSLETYRRNGKAVLTPVWFLQKNGSFYIRTLANAGKVKRIRFDHKVRFAPCNEKGDISSDWLTGQAILLNAIESKEIDHLLFRKYGLKKNMFDFIVRLRKQKWVIIRLDVTQTY
jgi:uncharacterized protein